MWSRNSLIGAFIAGVLVLLTAFLLVLSHRMRASLAELDTRTTQAIGLGDEISAMFSGEVGAIIGFQATQQGSYSEAYDTQRTGIESRVRRLDAISASVGSTVRPRFQELQSGIDAWHRSVASQEMTTRQLPAGKFRDVAFERLFVMRRAQDSTNAFNQAVLEYQTTERSRVQRLAYLFMALAVIFGPLALFALVLMVQVLRRLSATTSYLETRAREEEALRQVSQSLTAALTMDDVLRRVSEAIAFSVQAEDVCIEMINANRGELTCAAGIGSTVPPNGTTCPYVGSLAHDVLQDRQPRIVQAVDVERRPPSIFRDIIRRARHPGAMVIPLLAADQPLGAICVMRTKTPFALEELPKVRILADMASIALQRALTVERLQQLEGQEHLLGAITAALASSLDYPRTLKTVVHVAVSQMADVCVIHLVERGRLYHAEFAADPAKRDLVRQLHDKHRARPDLSLSVETAMRTRQAQLVREFTDARLRDYSVDVEHFEVLRQLELTSAIVAPLIVGPQTIGALVFLASGRHYDDDDVSLAKRIARRAASAIHNAQLFAVANEAIQLREEVLRVVAHDLRNPLSVIQLSAERLAANVLPYETHQKLLQSITGASERMNRLIEDLLTIGRLRANQRLPLDLHREDSGTIVEQVCEIMERSAVAKSIALRGATKPALPPILVDRTRILQVLTNLVDNAIKFTPQGGSIVVSAEETDGQVMFAVKDTGCGIEPEHREKIFDPFWQASATAHLGAGLGLAIAKAVVEQHHGWIRVESTPGHGTTVSFALPVTGVGEAPLNRTAA
jgi:signal transduction histidine kinase